MIVDSSAIIAMLMQEDDRTIFAQALAKASARSISAATLVETSIVLVGRLPDAPAYQQLDSFIAQTRIAIEPVTHEDALFAREAFLAFGKGRGLPAKLNFGDCFTYALARRLGRPILCKGDDFRHTDAAIVPLA